MKTLRQLLRQPLKSIAGLLLVALAAGLLCANAGQYIAALRTREQIERDYTTAALTTSKYMKQEMPGGGIIYLFDQPDEIQQFLAGLETEHPKAVRRVDRLGLISGYCPAITPFNYVQVPYREASSNGDAYSIIDFAPYTTAVLAVTLEEIGPTEKSDGGGFAIDWDGNRVPLKSEPKATVSLTGHIDQAVSLQEGFPDPSGRTLRFTVTGVHAEDLEDLGLCVGQRYLVAGNDYYDDDWYLRRYLVGWDMADSIDAVDWSRITPVDKIKDKDLLESIRHQGLMNGVETVAVYGEPVYGSGTCEQLTQYQLDMVNASKLAAYLSPIQHYHYEYIDDFTFHDISELTAYKESEEYQQAVQAAEAEFAMLYAEPSIARLDGTVEEFLASPEGALWKDYMAQADVTNHALPVLATPRLESVVQFIRGDTVIVEGRSFTEAEYAAGSRVCVLSESLAAANGLSVGDRIPLALYTADPNYNEYAIKHANPTADRYSAAQGFAAEEEEYEIVGLYRQTSEWSMDSYAFLPNTVFVPERAVTAETWTTASGIFQTIVLRNGAQEEMEAILEEAGYPGLFTYYDQGYTKIAPQLDELLNNVRVSFIAGVAAWVVILLLFLALFPLSQKKTAERMWALGAQSGHIRRHVLVVGIGLAVPGTVLGGALGYVLLQNALEKTAAESGFALTMEPWTVPALAGAQLLCCVIAIFLCGVFVARTGEKDKPSS